MLNNIKLFFRIGQKESLVKRVSLYFDETYFITSHLSKIVLSEIVKCVLLYFHEICIITSNLSLISDKVL